LALMGSLLHASAPAGMGLHQSTFRVNVSTFCGICWVVSPHQRQTRQRKS